jgi:glutamate-1-semialdehyde aminotransferase
LDGDTCTTHQAALSFRDLKSEWLQPILINDNPGAAKTYSAAAPVIYSMILVAETICSAKDESTFKQQQQQLVTFITTNTQQQNVQIKVTQQKLMVSIILVAINTTFISQARRTLFHHVRYLRVDGFAWR